ncbi:MAG: aspartate ammonia-lyase, partial [Phycisphaerales bacterium]|nr:aspartate ammonia-lyase [Phycisphaerales bacterium]
MASGGRSRATRTGSRKSPRKAGVRIERDTMGEMEVPSDALYGASTQRAVLNFPVSDRPLPLPIIRAFAELKRSAAEANGELGQVPRNRTRLIAAACRKLLAGLDGRDERDTEWWHSQFPIDVYQTGSGTSTNMNVNEVLSNLACLEAGAALGAKDPIHPNDHVNQGQSSNDTFPTAMQIAATVAIVGDLVPALEKLAASLRKKEKQWNSIVKTGRTHLQDATPIRLGQEFGGFAAQVEHGVLRAQRAAKRMGLNLPIGGTAVGTGINTHEKFGTMVVESLSRRLKIDFAKADNHFEAQSTRDCMVEASGELKTIAISLSKI